MSNGQPPDDAPIFTKRQLFQSVGQFVVVFLTTFAAHAASIKDVTWDTVYVSAMAAALSVPVVFGLSKIGPK